MNVKTPGYFAEIMSQRFNPDWTMEFLHTNENKKSIKFEHRDHTETVNLKAYGWFEKVWQQVEKLYLQYVFWNAHFKNLPEVIQQKMQDSRAYYQKLFIPVEEAKDDVDAIIQLRGYDDETSALLKALNQL